MLDRESLAKKIFSVVSKLFPEHQRDDEEIKKKWEEISSDGSFYERSQASQSSFLIPRWDGNLSDRFEVKPFSVAGEGDTFVEGDTFENYNVIAVDGSQIYPDRHVSGVGCFLINVGGVVLRYGERSTVRFFSEPHVLLPDEMREKFDNHDLSPTDVINSRDLIDLTREEFELEKISSLGVENAQSSSEGDTTKTVCLIDGSIIFWYLEGKHPAVKKFFLEKYLSYFEKLYQKKILVAGYVSMPKSRELVNLIKLGFCKFNVADCIKCHKIENHIARSRSEDSSRGFRNAVPSSVLPFPCKKVDEGAPVLDVHVARNILRRPGSFGKTFMEGDTFFRTTVFYNRSKILDSEEIDCYPDHLKPAFVYCDVGAEIVRIEFPAWIAKDRAAVDFVCSVCLDQSLKGQGYPVCLAESHEQAVVKGADRDFFYHLLQKIGVDKNKKIKFSEKAIKKRGMNV